VLQPARGLAVAVLLLTIAVLLLAVVVLLLVVRGE